MPPIDARFRYCGACNNRFIILVTQMLYLYMYKCINFTMDVLQTGEIDGKTRAVKTVT